MWKRDEAVKPVNGSPNAPIPTNPMPAAAIQTDTAPRTSAGATPVGRSVVIKGELSGNEDLTVEGTVEGTISLPNNVLTIGPSAKVMAQVVAKTVVVQGTVNGNVSASEKMEIRDGATVDGDVITPRLSIADGAHFRGAVDMRTVQSEKRAAQSAPRGAGSEKAASAPAVVAVAH